MFKNYTNTESHWNKNWRDRKSIVEWSDQILDDETYRISIEKRNSNVSSQEIITSKAVSTIIEIENREIKIIREGYLTKEEILRLWIL